MFNKENVLFYIFLIVTIFIHYKLVELAHTYWLPLWFAQPNGIQFLIMTIVVLSFIVIPLIVTKKLTEYFISN